MNPQIAQIVKKDDPQISPIAQIVKKGDPQISPIAQIVKGMLGTVGANGIDLVSPTLCTLRHRARMQRKDGRARRPAPTKTMRACGPPE